MPAPRTRKLNTVGRKPMSPEERRELAKAEETLFYSGDGTDIRVTHPDGAVAIVGAEPRTLPPKLWRRASQAGCIRVGNGQQVSRQQAEDDNAGNPGPGVDAHTRVALIEKAMFDAVAAPENSEGFEDAFTEAEIPNLIWLSAYVGFQVDASERDRIWGQVSKKLDEMEDGDAESGAND